MISHSEKMVAPCGMNCTYCYVHHKKKNPCLGCREDSKSTPKSCRQCKIKECVGSKSLNFCNECEDYQCVLVKRLEKSYQERYEESLVRNLSMIKDQGMESYLNQEKERLKCPHCEGVINIHDKICSSCGKIALKNSVSKG